MPLHEPPLQKCGTGHWLTDPCPRGKCELLSFDRGAKLVNRPRSVDPKEARLKVAAGAVEEAKRREALSNAERQRRYRERKRKRDAEKAET